MERVRIHLVDAFDLGAHSARPNTVADDGWQLNQTCSLYRESEKTEPNPCWRGIPSEYAQQVA
jgi:hypothetical protein